MAALKNRRHEAYALERSLSYSPREAERRAGFKPGCGQATKLELNAKVRARIAELAKLGFTEERTAAIRESVHERLFRIFRGGREDFDPADLERGLPDWADVLAAANQLRDMHGFKGSTKLEHTGKDGAPLEGASNLDIARRLAFIFEQGARALKPEPSA